MEVHIQGFDERTLFKESLQHVVMSEDVVGLFIMSANVELDGVVDIVIGVSHPQGSIASIQVAVLNRDVISSLADLRVSHTEEFEESGLQFGDIATVQFVLDD